MTNRNRTRLYPPAPTAVCEAVARPIGVDASAEPAIGRAALQIGALIAALTASAWIRVYLPFTPVPFTLQTMVVLLAGHVLGPRRAMLGILAYVGMGMAGAPVLTGPIGPTFGYLLAFAVTPWITTGIRNTAVAMTAATLFILGVGAAWLALWAGVSYPAALAMGALPFLPGDAVKAVIAAKIALHWRSRP